MNKLKIKTMAIVFFKWRGIVYHEYVLPGCTITADFYIEVLAHLCEQVHRVRLQLCQNKLWILHLDNAIYI